MPKLTVREAAEELGISEQRVRRLIITGRIRATRNGLRAYLIDLKALDAVRTRAPGRPPKKLS